MSFVRIFLQIGERLCFQGETLQKISLEQNEAAVSVAICKFSNQGEQTYVLVGVARDLQLNPRQARGGGEIHTYTISDDGTKLDIVHKVGGECANSVISGQIVYVHIISVSRSAAQGRRIRMM